ncbi:MAG: bifunctional homocysteine S-methyltransferase/methylenetetrahydrofolate reductase [Ignavibacteriales bacterium]|nr:bifunctional homocysteine S-methyltransferase/methylenetetrahydrofolate reductase [Ignavibacteriales bacterium]
MKLDFRQRLKQGPILCDGAMGTLLDLYEYTELPHELNNVKHPDIVERIHREYVAAGAEIIQTNTFSCNRFRLAHFHLEHQLELLNRTGVEIAKRAAGTNVYVAGSVGPTGKLLEPIGKLKAAEARDAFKKQIEILLAAGIDVIMLETFVSLHELDLALEAAKAVAGLPDYAGQAGSVPIIAQKAFPEDGSILSGSFPIEVAEHLIGKGADVVGANCTVGPQRMFSIIRSMYKEGVYLSAQPAAGIPTLLNGRSIYHTTPAYLAQYAKELLEAGVTLIGACCGSTPAHIREMKNVLEEFKQRSPEIRMHEPHPKRKTPAAQHQREEIVRAHVDHRSRFAKNLGKKFLTSVELDIPRGLDVSSILDGAAYLHRFAVDAVNITDGARARLRVSSIALSQMVQQHIGIEAMVHLATRDRNMIGLQAELLGAHALGLRNMLFITGDPTSIGDYPQATSVFDIDSVGLIRAAASMNKGHDLLGNSIEQSTSFFIACAVNASADNMELEIEKLRRKADAGAHLVYTQPIYEIKTLEALLEHTQKLNLPVMLGLLPLRGAKHAEFLHNEIPGMSIPSYIREQFRNAGEKASALGIEITVKFLDEAKALVAGAYLMPPFKKYEMVPQILEGAGIKS